MDILTGDRLLACTELGMELWHAAEVKHFMQLSEWPKTTDAQEPTVASCSKENSVKSVNRILLSEGETLEHIANWGCAISSLEGIQNSTGQSALILK